MKSSTNHSALQAYQFHYCYKTAALSCGFYFYSLNTFSLKPKRNLPIPLHCSPLSAEKAVSMNTKATGGHGIGSPCKPPSRVQRVRSAIRDVPSAALRPTRWTRRGNPRSGRFAGGEDLWCYLPKRAVLQKSLAPARRAGEILSRAAPRVLHGEAMPLRRWTTCNRTKE